MQLVYGSISRLSKNHHPCGAQSVRPHLIFHSVLEIPMAVTAEVFDWSKTTAVILTDAG